MAPSPRPWPPAPEHQSRSSALAALASRPQPATVSQALPGGPVNPALLSQLNPPQDPWRATPTPSGWTVPRNPNRRALEARDPFEIPEGTTDLPELRLLPSYLGRISGLWLQWPEEVMDPAWSAQKAVFHDLFTRLPEEVRFEIVAEGLASERLRRLIDDWGPARPERISIHSLSLRSSEAVLYEPLTLWARDGAVLARSQGTSVLLLPRSFRGHGQVDPKLNRQIIHGTAAAPARLGQVLPGLEVRRTGLSFEGGDVVASETHVLVGADSLSRTMSERRMGRAACLEEFSQQFGLMVVVVEPQPEFHIDLGFTFLDSRTLAVADPGTSLARVADLPALEAQRRVTLERQLPQRYDEAARRLEEQGFRVVRLPHLAGLSLSTPHCTYNNVLLESDAERRRVYLPVYGIPQLDEPARATYRQQGFEVVDMPSARLSTLLWGSLRCACGDLSRSG